MGIVEVLLIWDICHFPDIQALLSFYTLAPVSCQVVNKPVGIAIFDFFIEFFQDIDMSALRSSTVVAIGHIKAIQLLLVGCIQGFTGVEIEPRIKLQSQAEQLNRCLQRCIDGAIFTACCIVLMFGSPIAIQTGRNNRSEMFQFSFGCCRDMTGQINNDLLFNHFKGHDIQQLLQIKGADLFLDPQCIGHALGKLIKGWVVFGTVSPA